MISVGGFFLTTKPDLKILLRKNGESFTMLYHEASYQEFVVGVVLVIRVVLVIFLVTYHFNFYSHWEFRNYNAGKATDIKPSSTQPFQRTGDLANAILNRVSD
jgi:hypothetical protein